MRRRTYLGVLTGGLASLAGCSGLLGSSSGPPVVDNSVDRSERNLEIEVTVVRDDTPQEGTAVLLQDGGGSHDVREGTTGSEGTIVFRESVGPPPCNDITLEFPEADAEYAVGCHDGGQTITERVDLADL